MLKDRLANNKSFNTVDTLLLNFNSIAYYSILIIQYSEKTPGSRITSHYPSQRACVSQYSAQPHVFLPIGCPGAEDRGGGRPHPDPRRGKEHPPAASTHLWPSREALRRSPRRADGIDDPAERSPANQTRMRHCLAKKDVPADE